MRATTATGPPAMQAYPNWAFGSNTDTGIGGFIRTTLVAATQGHDPTLTGARV